MTTTSPKSTFSGFAAQLREFIHARSSADEAEFNRLALSLFALQFSHNAAYRRFCQARKAEPGRVKHWLEIPAMPTAGFKELELTSLPPEQRTQVFHSSGTTEQRPSRHFHNADSLAIYEASLAPWFREHFLPEENWSWLFLTPAPGQAPHSSLVHMFDTLRREFGFENSHFAGFIETDGGWGLDADAIVHAFRCNFTPAATPSLPRSGGESRGEEALMKNASISKPLSPALSPRCAAGRGSESRSGCQVEPHAPQAVIAENRPVILFGTAFNFVHLLDYLSERDVSLALPPGSRVLETGGYKGRSRSLPKAELHALITKHLGIPASHIVCEYGMSELSSQAYDVVAGGPQDGRRVFHFPPWARVQIVSPETGREVGEGETGLIRIFDLANVYSVMAIQTEDLGVRRGSGFELLGRAALSEPRGCSLMSL